jgi:hypothetical protein
MFVKFSVKVFKHFRLIEHVDLKNIKRSYNNTTSSRPPKQVLKRVG